MTTVLLACASLKVLQRMAMAISSPGIESITSTTRMTETLLIIAAIVWAMGSNSSNPHLAGRGKLGARRRTKPVERGEAEAALERALALETDLAMRTRMFDCLWGELPVVTSPAGGTDPLIERYGAGIVVDSVPEHEDLECHNKARALLAAVPAVFVCLHRWPWPLRATGVCLLLPLLWSSPRAPPQGQPRHPRRPGCDRHHRPAPGRRDVQQAGGGGDPEQPRRTRLLDDGVGRLHHPRDERHHQRRARPPTAAVSTRRSAFFPKNRNPFRRGTCLAQSLGVQ